MNVKTAREYESYIIPPIMMLCWWIWFGEPWSCSLQFTSGMFTMISLLKTQLY